MTTEGAYLKDYCEKTAEEFLKTVFVVDDEATFNAAREETTTSDTSEAPDNKEDEVIEVSLKGGEEADANSTTPVVTPDRKVIPVSETDSEVPTERTNNILDVKVLTEAFLEKGIFCSAYKPPDSEKPYENCEIALKNADVLILDWDINNDSQGTHTKNIINEIVKDNNETPKRRALIVVYSALNPNDIEEKLKEILHLGETIEYIEKNGIRIVVVQKKSDEDKLPAKVIEEFGKMHSGILERAALMVMTGIRENTFEFISRFNQEMDAPFLAHRTILPTPEDAEAHILELLVSDLSSLIFQLKSNNELMTKKMIKDWFLYRLSNGLSIETKPNSSLTPEEISDHLTMIVYSGITDVNSNTDFPKLVIAKNKSASSKKKKNIEACEILVSAIAGSSVPADVRLLNSKLSNLFSIQNSYINKLPALSFGTILQDRSEGYWLCLMPLCDSVRIVGERGFPFLELNSAVEEKFDISLLKNDEPVYLKVNYTVYEQKYFWFTLRENALQIFAIKEDEEFVFRARNRKIFNWRGIFKREFAQKIANEYSSHVSRVGVNESEWQRLNAG